jgi:hypothetical protein
MLFLRRSGKALDPSNSTEIPELMKFQFFKVLYRTRMSSIVRITSFRLASDDSSYLTGIELLWTAARRKSEECLGNDI